MGCCTSSPHAQRVYRDPSDFDEELVPLRYVQLQITEQVRDSCCSNGINQSNVSPEPSTYVLGTLDKSGADPTLFPMMWAAYLRLT
jgi:hypothetical protein